MYNSQNKENYEKWLRMVNKITPFGQFLEYTGKQGTEENPTKNKNGQKRKLTKKTKRKELEGREI